MKGKRFGAWIQVFGAGVQVFGAWVQVFGFLGRR